MENIFAYTEPGSDFPAFVSLNVVDGKCVLSVRSRGQETPATIELDPDDLDDMAADILNHLHPYDGDELLIKESTEVTRLRDQARKSLDILNAARCTTNRAALFDLIVKATLLLTPNAELTGRGRAGNHEVNRHFARSLSKRISDFLRRSKHGTSNFL